MELFSLLAKLTLDAKEYYTELDNAQAEAENFDNPATKKLELDNRDYNENLEDSQTESESFGSIVTDVFQNVKSALIATGVVGAVAGIVKSLREAVELTAQTADAIDKGSKRLGISTKSYQEWDHALKQSGASINDLQRGVAMLNNHLAGEENEDISSAFEQLGIDVHKANGELKTTEELVKESLLALAGYEGSTDERGALVTKLFGRGATSLNALLDEGTEGVKALMDEAGDLGLIMSEDEIANAVAYGDAVANLQAEITAVKTAFVQDLMPVLTSAVETITKIVAFFNGRTGENTLSKQFEETNKSLAKDLITIEGTSGAAMDMVEKLFAMGDAEKLTAEQQAEWKSTAEWLIQNIPSLSAQIDLDTLSINTNKDAIMANIEEWRILSTERAIASAKEAKYQAMLEANSEAIDKQASARAKENEVIQKQNERIAEANNLLKANEGLSDVFSARFGTSEIDKGSEDFEDMMDWMTDVGYEYANTQTFQDLTNEYLTLRREQGSLAEDASKYDEQLQKAQDEYEEWCVAVEELYGATSEEAKNAKSDVDNLKEALDSLPDEKHIGITIGDDDPNSYAIGSAYIPYDQLAYVHRGEKIVPAAEARRQDRADYGADIGREIREAMGRVNVMMSGEKVGNLTTKQVGRNINANNYSKLRAMGG